MATAFVVGGFTNTADAHGVRFGIGFGPSVGFYGSPYYGYRSYGYRPHYGYNGYSSPYYGGFGYSPYYGGGFYGGSYYNGPYYGGSPYGGYNGGWCR
ncbi:MAG: spore coat protein [Planctomycetaceae bacterium]|nr:spore coat protein [Planctomycetaceae bacterium]